MLKQTLRLVPALLLLAGCGATDHLGHAPAMTEAAQGDEFDAMTMPEIAGPERFASPQAAASLWAGTGSASLVADRRATQRGDILTVVIQIDDKAEMSNSSGRQRTSSDTVSVPQFGGIPQRLDARLPEGASMDDLVEAGSSSSYRGNGSISRRDRLTLRVAATVVETMPNGVLRIQGSQEVRVNFELRELTVSGFVRPQDIGRNNEVAYDRIAGARISYGGRGQVMDVQQPRIGQQIADVILPY